LASHYARLATIGTTGSWGAHATLVASGRHARELQVFIQCFMKLKASNINIGVLNNLIYFLRFSDYFHKTIKFIALA
jgi:hypothetical protein